MATFFLLYMYIILGQQFTCEKGIGQSETVTVQEERQF